MKQRIYLLIVAGFALTTLACGLTGGLLGQDESTATQPPLESGSRPQAPAPGSAWEDIPVYPGASVLLERRPNPGLASLCTTAEQDVYATADTIEQVDAFYQAQMPKYGWEPALHLCRDDRCNSSWFKDGAKIQAVVEVGPGPEGGTAFALSRAAGCSGSPD